MSRRPLRTRSPCRHPRQRRQVGAAGTNRGKKEIRPQTQERAVQRCQTWPPGYRRRALDPLDQ